MTTTQTSFESFAAQFPDAVAALRTLSKVSAQGLDKGLVELVKVRASQINGCAYCLQFHINLARKFGVSKDKLDLVAVWREASIFAPLERAAFAWAESLTDPQYRESSAEANAALAEHLNEDQIIRLTIAVATINAWNRIAGPLGFEPPAAD
jgi:AhpD family alkylhydroperoxidase